MIKSPLHGKPVVYNNESEEVKEIQNDGYLTYVYEVGENIVLQYITTDGLVYGLLLNDKLETIAYLPYLCDIVDNEVYFDLPNGKVRKSKVYSLVELEEMGIN